MRFIGIAAFLTLPGLLIAASALGEVLYNGIKIPDVWPPRDHAVTLVPMDVPYLASPPEVISIDVGRQLFVDDFLIEKTTLRRTFHAARYHPLNPVLKPDKPWEQEGGPTAMVFSDGVWYDPQDRLFKMWYMGGYLTSTCYATSKDGIRWEKPSLDVYPGTNMVHKGSRDSATIWLDLREPDASRRYKFFRAHKAGPWIMSLYFSPDGIHWCDEVAISGPCGDRTTVFYNPFRRVWVYSIREYTEIPNSRGPMRVRRYWEHPDVIQGMRWNPGEPPLWVGSDQLDPKRPEYDVRPELYNLDAVAYESIMLGLFTIWQGQAQYRPKPNQVFLGFSRDGFHWDRPFRKPFIPVSERKGAWNWGNVQSAGGGCLIVGDRLYFYVSGRAGVEGSSASGVSSTGLATLRRDGFASMGAGPSEGALTTRSVRFSGKHKHLFVNADADEGELRIEVLDASGKVIAPFSRANCLPICADKTLQQVSWKGGADLSKLDGKPVRFRFYLKNSRLYAFWVSDKSGASRGYVAAGGPGFAGPTDTTGSGAYGR